MMTQMRCRGVIVILLGLMLLPLALPLQAFPQAPQEEHRRWVPFWEEAKWGSVSASLTMLGFAALMAPTCELICSAVPDPLAQEDCLGNCGTMLGEIGFLTVPLGAAAGVAWAASKHEIPLDFRHFLASYGGGLLMQFVTVIILTHLRYPESLLGPIGAGLAIFTLSVVDGLGATIGFNLGLDLWSMARADEDRGSSLGESRGALELSIQLASF